MTLDRYGQMALDHMKNYLPTRYSHIPDPETHFRQVGEEVAHQVATLEMTLAGSSPSDADYMTRAGQLRAAHMAAEEIVLADLVFLPPEIPDPNDPTVTTDETGAYTGWRDPTRQEIFAPLPVWEDWESEMWADGIDPETGRPAWTDSEIQAKTPQSPPGRPSGTSSPTHTNPANPAPTDPGREEQPNPDG
jgi:hypothetical protein